MVLDGGLVLWVRRSSGDVTSYSTGRFESDGHRGLKIYDLAGALVEELPSGIITGWQVVAPDGQIIASDQPV
jgi:hypothetical protein